MSQEHELDFGSLSRNKFSDLSEVVKNYHSQKIFLIASITRGKSSEDLSTEDCFILKKGF